MTKEINFEEVTDRQKLELKKALLDYQFIMNHIKDYNNMKDDDKYFFKKLYYNFYLKSRRRKLEYWGAYFDLLDITKKGDRFEDVIRKIFEKYKTYEFSFATKLLHTKDSDMPIYDSKVYHYLKGEIPLKWQNVGVGKKVEQIKEDYQNLVDWYKKFQESDEGKKWIVWFEKEFPNNGILDVKKIDFIIFALT